MGPEGTKNCLEKSLNTGKQKYNNTFCFIVSFLYNCWRLVQWLLLKWWKCKLLLRVG